MNTFWNQLTLGLSILIMVLEAVSGDWLGILPWLVVALCEVELLLVKYRVGEG